MRGGRAANALYRLPAPLKALGTTAMLVPFSPLFMAPLSEGGTLDAMLANAVRVRVRIVGAAP